GVGQRFEGLVGVDLPAGFEEFGRVDKFFCGNSFRQLKVVDVREGAIAESDDSDSSRCDTVFGENVSDLDTGCAAEATFRDPVTLAGLGKAPYGAADQDGTGGVGEHDMTVGDELPVVGDVKDPAAEADVVTSGNDQC